MWGEEREEAGADVTEGGSKRKYMRCSIVRLIIGFVITIRWSRLRILHFTICGGSKISDVLHSEWLFLPAAAQHLALGVS